MIEISLKESDLEKFRAWAQEHCAVKDIYISKNSDGAYRTVYLRELTQKPQQNRGTKRTVDRAEIAKLLYGEKLSYRAIAQRVGCSQGTVTATNRECRAQARILLETAIKNTKKGWIYLTEGRSVKVAQKRADAFCGDAAVLGRLGTDDIDMMVERYLSYRANLETFQL